MTLIRLLAPKTGANRWATIFACLAYILSPIDLLPEAFLGPFGLGDDMVAFVVMVRHLTFPGRER